MSALSAKIDITLIGDAESIESMLRALSDRLTLSAKIEVKAIVVHGSDIGQWLQRQSIAGLSVQGLRGVALEPI